MPLTHLPIFAVIKDGAVLSASTDREQLAHLVQHFGGEIQSGLFVFDAGAAADRKTKRAMHLPNLTNRALAKRVSLSKRKPKSKAAAGRPPGAQEGEVTTKEFAKIHKVSESCVFMWLKGDKIKGRRVPREAGSEQMAWVIKADQPRPERAMAAAG